VTWVDYKEFRFAKAGSWYWVILPNGLKWQMEAKNDDEIKIFCDNYLKN